MPGSQTQEFWKFGKLATSVGTDEPSALGAWVGNQIPIARLAGVQHDSTTPGATSLFLHPIFQRAENQTFGNR